MVPVKPGLFLKITGTGIIITKKGPGFTGTGTGIPVGHYTYLAFAEKIYKDRGIEFGIQKTREKKMTPSPHIIIIIII